MKVLRVCVDACCPRSPPLLVPNPQETNAGRWRAGEGPGATLSPELPGGPPAGRGSRSQLTALPGALGVFVSGPHVPASRAAAVSRLC